MSRFSDPHKCPPHHRTTAYSPAKGASPWYSSTQSVELDKDTELREPLDADAGDLFKSNLPEHLLYSYCVRGHYITMSMHLIYMINAFWCAVISIQHNERISDENRRSREREAERTQKRKKREIEFYNF